MDRQAIDHRAATARTEFDRWATAQLCIDPTTDPFTLASRAIAHFGPDGDFIRNWILATFRDHVAQVIAHQGGVYDAPEPDTTPGPASSLARVATMATRVPARRKEPGGWRTWLATEKVPTRVKLMTRTDLAAIVAAEKEEGLARLKLASLAQHLMARMGDDVTVGDVWDDDELQALTTEIDDRAAWAGAEPVPLALADLAQ